MGRNINFKKQIPMIKDYQKLALRTMALKPDTASNGAHMALGFTTELGEMVEGMERSDKVNVREEHGDYNWYIANECNIYDLNFEQLYNIASNSITIPYYLHNIVDLHKKEFAYNKEMDLSMLADELISAIQYLQKVAKTFGFSYEESLERNIEKLTARYPEKFTSEQALVRDLQKEREILEK